MAMNNVRRYLPGRRRRERKFAGKADFQWLRGDRYVTFARTRATPSWIGPGFGSFTEKMRDRKSTRLNSSHLVISYAVFCLKKKKHDRTRVNPVQDRMSTEHT